MARKSLKIPLPPEATKPAEELPTFDSELSRLTKKLELLTKAVQLLTEYKTL